MKAWRPTAEEPGWCVFGGSTESTPIVAVRKTWRGLLKTANVTSFRFHDLRHTFASKLVMGRGGSKYSARITGSQVARDDTPVRSLGAGAQGRSRGGTRSNPKARQGGLKWPRPSPLARRTRPRRLSAIEGVHLGVSKKTKAFRRPTTPATRCSWLQWHATSIFGSFRDSLQILEAPPGCEPGIEVLQTGPNAYLVDSSCFLVGPVPPFSLVFGRYCSQIVPTLRHAQR